MASAERVKRLPGGASRLVDTLLDEGFDPRAEEVAWIEADVTKWRPDQTYAVWHDRAVFH
jgi:hypothetical protein